MGTITPILDTLLPQVFGRAGDVARVGARSADGPLSPLRPISGEIPSNAPRQTPYPGRSSVESAAGTAGGPRSTATADTSRSLPVPAALPGTSPSTASAQLHLSRGGDALARLLGTLGAGQHAIHQAGPLADGLQQPRASVLAGLLGQQITASGLFYESHLAQWVRGRYPLAKLQAEPQAGLNAPGGNPNTSPESTSGAGTASDRPGVAPSADPRLAAIVRQQAEILASGVFQWQGQAWPGVPMRWQVQERPEQDGDAASQGFTHTTSLSLELAGLGAFEARLSIGEGRVRIAAWAEQGPGRTLLAADLKTLRNRLQQAGFSEPVVHLLTESDHER